jgi:hypothetical protein
MGAPYLKLEAAGIRLRVRTASYYQSWEIDPRKGEAWDTGAHGVAIIRRPGDASYLVPWHLVVEPIEITTVPLYLETDESGRFAILPPEREEEATGWLAENPEPLEEIPLRQMEPWTRRVLGVLFEHALIPMSEADDGPGGYM